MQASFSFQSKERLKTFVACLMHETNTFSPIPTTLSNFQDGIYYHPGSAKEGDPAPTYIGYSDFVNWAEKNNHEIIPSVLAVAEPSAPLCKGDYQKIIDKIIDDIRKALPLDIVFLMLHGAQISEECDDCEGDLISRIRHEVGAGTTIAVELDLHCNLSAKMINGADIVAACKEYPHTDFTETAYKVAELAERTRKGTVKPTMTAIRVPMVGVFPTIHEPLKSLVAEIRKLEESEKVLSISILHGFMWGDTANTGASVIVITNDDMDYANALAVDIANKLLSIKEQLHISYPDVNAAIDMALNFSSQPVVIADISDNPGGGAAADSTYFLQALLKRKIQNAAVGMIWDPTSIKEIYKANEGDVVNLSVGGRVSMTSGHPVELQAKILKKLDNAEQILPGTDKRSAIGRAAAVAAHGIDIVLCEQRRQTFGTECFSQFGIDLKNKKIIIVKSTQHFYESFSKISHNIIQAQAPGLLNSNMSAFSYTKLTRPIWPLDEDVGQIRTVA